MPINQISTSNTFAQWLVATQALIENQNFVEDSANVITDTANSITIFVNESIGEINNVYNNTVVVFEQTESVYDNTVIVFNNTVDVFNNTVDVFNNIQSYVSSAYDTANIVSQLAIEANDRSTFALITANAALNASNTFFENIFNIQDESSNTVIHYPLFTPLIAGVPEDVYISSTKLSYRPSTGNLFSSILSSNSVVTTIVTTGNVTASGLISGQNITASNTVTTGNVTASGLISAQDFNSTSDISLKENIVPIENSLGILQNLTGIRFNWKDTKEISYGLSAQEVESILPEIVKTRENGLKGVNYSNIIAILIESVKQLKLEIELLKKHK